MPTIDSAVALSTRQEAFCRHYAVSGNAAGAARQAGYSVRSARQTGSALPERPWIMERVRMSAVQRSSVLRARMATGLKSPGLAKKVSARRCSRKACDSTLIFTIMESYI